MEWVNLLANTSTSLSSVSTWFTWFMYCYLVSADSPVVQAELEMVHSGPGFQAALSCIVTAHPRPTVRWYRDSLLLDSDNNFLLESRGSLHTLIILR